MTCFVCFSDDSQPVYKVCKCHTVVHEHCFIRLLQEVPAHELCCPICLDSYDTYVRRTYRKRIRVDGDSFVILCAYLALLLVTMLLVAWSMEENVDWFLVMMLVLEGCFVGSVLWTHFCRSLEQSFCFFVVERRVSGVESLL